MKWQSSSKLILRWGGINGAFLLFAFLIIGLLCVIFPQVMLTVFGMWASLLSSFGAKTASELGSSNQMFAHILQRNIIAGFVFFIIGFLLQAPVAMLFCGAFYAFIVFLAPITMGQAFGFFDWILIGVEILALVTSASTTSGFAGELYQVKPTVRDWWRYSKKTWKSISMKAPNDWREILPSWRTSILTGILATIGMILFVAWFEVYGY